VIHLGDAIILATTKLRTRRIRTGITVVVSGLLFGCLVATLFMAKGAFDSISKFNAIGLGSRYIVQAQTVPLTGVITQDKDLQARAQELYTQQVADKKAAAKKLGITYDATADRPPVISPDGKATNTFLDISTPVALQAVREYMQAHPQPGMGDLKRTAAPYHPKNFYTTETLSTGDGTLVTMNNGVENLTTNQPDLGTQYQQDILMKYPLQLTPTAISRPFMLPATSLSSDHPDAIPIIVTYSAAEKVLGMTPLSKGVPAAQKLERIRTLYRKAGSGVLAACYRNTVSTDQIQTAITTAADIAKNKDNKDYQKPSLIYGLPAADSCGPATIARDVRTTDEKSQAAKQKQFDAQFNTVTEPDQQKIEFRIVGLMPDTQDGAPSSSASGILQGLVGSSLAGVIAVPEDMYNALPSAARYKAVFNSTPTSVMAIFSSTSTYYAEFANDTTARAFIDNASCNPSPSGCSKAKPFMLNAFGSNSIALQDLQRKFRRAALLGAGAIVFIAVAIMTGTVGRMIADSRRETAVFRAVGAGRFDITFVYTLYAIMLSVCIAVFALGLGLLLARLADWKFWQTATAQAQLVFGGSNLSLQFRFFGINTAVGWVLLATLGTGLISMILPLLRNIRRSPIKDMRDE